MTAKLMGRSLTLKTPFFCVSPPFRGQRSGGRRPDATSNVACDFRRRRGLLSSGPKLGCHPAVALSTRLYFCPFYVNQYGRWHKQHRILCGPVSRRVHHGPSRGCKNSAPRANPALGGNLDGTTPFVQQVTSRRPSEPLHRHRSQRLLRQRAASGKEARRAAL